MTYAGTTWLVSGGELPWTPEDIREHLRLLDPSFDHLIDAAIFSQCSRYGVGSRGQVWAVARGDDLGSFFARANAIGKLEKIGPAYLIGGKSYHDCTYGVDSDKARKAFRSIINWCHDDEGIYRAMRREDRGEYRTPNDPDTHWQIAAE